MSVSQSVFAAGYFIHIKKITFFLTFRLTELIRAQRPRRFSETKKSTGKKSGVFLRRTRSELLRPPLICGLLIYIV